MKKGLVFLLLASSFLCGCAQSYDILSIEQSGNEAYIMLPSGTQVYVGEKLRILPSIQSDELYRHGRLLKPLGKVEIVRVFEDGRIQVRILEGIVKNGVRAEVFD